MTLVLRYIKSINITTYSFISGVPPQCYASQGCLHFLVCVDREPVLYSNVSAKIQKSLSVDQKK